MTKKKREEPQAKCNDCEGYINPILSKKAERKCSITEAWVFNEYKACSQFVLNKFFWCDKFHYRVGVSACSNKRLRRDNGCTRCKQGWFISEIRKAYSYGGIKLIKRKQKDTETPTLIKRRQS